MKKTVRQKNIDQYTQVYRSDSSSGSYEVRVKIESIYRLIPKLKKNESLLEIGFGTGDLLHKIAESNKKSTIIGIELVKTAITLYKKRFPDDKNVELLLGDGEKKFNPKIKKVDWIICSHVLEHIKDDKGFLKRVLGLLNKNGNLIIAVPEWENIENHLHYRQYSKNSLLDIQNEFNLKIKRIIPDGLFMNKFYYFIINLNKKKIEYINNHNDNKKSNLIHKIYYDYFVPFLLFINKIDYLLFSKIDKHPMQWIVVYTKK